jgi:transcriptional regulator with XRE-family HTH domain
MYEKYLALLAEHGVTTATVCKETGISESTMSMWKSRQEKGAKLGVENLAKIAKYFGVPIEYFLEDK